MNLVGMIRGGGQRTWTLLDRMAEGSLSGRLTRAASDRRGSETGARRCNMIDDRRESRNLSPRNARTPGGGWSSLFDLYSIVSPTRSQRTALSQGIEPSPEGSKE